MLKVYETIGTLNRSTVINIDGREIHISFTNGTDTPRLIQGRYSTTNPQIQKALEDSPAFNVRWKLVKSFMHADDRVVIPSLPEVPDDDKATAPPIPLPQSSDDSSDDKAVGSLPEETDEDITPEPGSANTPDIIETIINGQQARNYLIEKYGLTFRQVSNNAQIIAEAKTRGIQFINWEAFVNAE